ncbi:MAG: 6-bladed beta-propeller [Thiogranum sp.]
MNVLRIPVAGLVFGLLASCAQTPTEMSYFPAGGDSDEKRSLLWPSLPEVPRYRYTGQLLGEQNFGPAERSDPGIGETVFRWIVGLGAGFRSDPRVLMRPQSGMVEAGGRIIVTDVGRGAIFVFDPSQGKLFIWDRADKGSAFTAPVGVTAGVDGEILVADSELHRVVRLRSDGKPLGSFGADSLRRPTGLARDPATGRVYVADTRAHDIKVFDDNGKLLYSIGRHGSAAGEFNAPTHISLVKDRLYVADTLNARVQILTMDGQPLKTVGRRGLYVGNLTRPKGVTADNDGNVYVVESYYDHLLVFSQEGEFLLPIGGTGAGIGQFYLPAGVWSDDRGRLFVADMYNGRVVIFQYLGG